MFLTQEDLEAAQLRLTRRSSQALAAFILSLVHTPGPTGEQIRSFVVADDQRAFIDSLSERLDTLRAGLGRRHRARQSQEVAERLELILDAIEEGLLHTDPTAAFQLLVRVIECDAPALENAADEGIGEVNALKRASTLLANIAARVPNSEAEIRRLLAHNCYGARDTLSALLPAEQGGESPG